MAGSGDEDHDSGGGGEEPPPVVLPIEDELDLHPFAPSDTASVVEEYLTAARARGHREVRLVHGRGTGVQRRIVQSAITRHPAVASFHDAPAHRGGWGATIVLLRPLDDEER